MKDDLARRRARLVERYAPRRRVHLRVMTDDYMQLVDYDVIRDLGATANAVFRTRLPVRIDVPAQLAIPEHRGIVDRLLGRHPGPLRECGAVVRVPVWLNLEIEVRE